MHVFLSEVSRGAQQMSGCIVLPQIF